MNPLHERRLLADLRKLPQFKIVDKKWGIGKCRSFYIRWRANIVVGAPANIETTIEFAEKKTFDKWANSTNFTVNNWNCDSNYRANLVDAHKWMEKVCRSKLFDFNCYYNTIYTRHKMIKNKYRK